MYKVPSHRKSCQQQLCRQWPCRRRAQQCGSARTAGSREQTHNGYGALTAGASFKRASWATILHMRTGSTGEWYRQNILCFCIQGTVRSTSLFTRSHMHKQTLHQDHFLFTRFHMHGQIPDQTFWTSLRASASQALFGALPFSFPF